MKRFAKRAWRLAGMAMAAAVAAPNALACSVCFGQSDSKMAEGMNMGILALLGVITTVLFGVASFFVFVARREARLMEGGVMNGGPLEPGLAPAGQTQNN